MFWSKCSVRQTDKDDDKIFNVNKYFTEHCKMKIKYLNETWGILLSQLLWILIYFPYCASCITRHLLLASFNAGLSRSDVSMCLFCRSMKSDSFSRAEWRSIRKWRRRSVVLLRTMWYVKSVFFWLFCVAAASAGAWLLSWKREWEPEMVGFALLAGNGGFECCGMLTLFVDGWKL